MIVETRLHIIIRMSNMATNVPLLNDYKLDFFKKRFTQTICGGPKLKLGFKAPAYVYLWQILVFFIPWILGGTFTIFTDLNILSEIVSSIICGSLVTLFVLICQIISRISQKKIKQSASNQVNLTSDEDDIDFDGCANAETITFVIQPKKYIFNIIYHSLIAGGMCGLATWCLLPSVIYKLFNQSYVASSLLFVFGWLTVSIAQYPLTTSAPFELATYRPTDRYEVQCLLRPFYALTCLAWHPLAQWNSQFAVGDQIAHILMIFLPLLWMGGMLPPVDCFFLWLFERTTVLLFGGTNYASDSRTLILTIVAASTVITSVLITDDLASLIVLCSFGYILSIDLGGLGSQIIFSIRKRMQNRDEKISTTLWSPPVKHFLYVWSWKEVLYHILIVGVCCATTSIIKTYATSINSSIRDVVGYAVIGTTALVHILGLVQSVHVFFALIQNRMYPSDVSQSAFTKSKRKWRAFSWLRRILLTFVLPLLLVADWTMFVSASPVPKTDVWGWIGVCKMFRMAWQSSFWAGLDFSVFFILRLIVPSSYPWTNLSVGIQLLTISCSRHILLATLRLAHFYMMLLITSWTYEKQRRKHGLALLVIQLLMFPLALVLCVICAALGAPLLPIFTLPVFLPGFPRPLRLWSGPVGSSAHSCADSMYYEQLVPGLLQELRVMAASGSLGELEPGEQLLVRFQDRLAWISILEVGHAHFVINVKGLELQETSCHTIEAGRVDEIFETAFEDTPNKRCCTITGDGASARYFNVLTPLDAGVVKTYSDAKNQLTGIIDSPQNLRVILDAFKKALIWHLIKFSLLDLQSKQKQTRPATAKVAPFDVPSQNPQETTNNVSVFVTSRPTSALSHKSLNNSDWGSDDETVELSPVKKPLPSRLPPLRAKRSSEISSDDIDDLLNNFGGGDTKHTYKPSNNYQSDSGVVLPKPITRSNVNATYDQPTSLTSNLPTATHIAGSGDHGNTNRLPQTWTNPPVDSKKLSQDQFPKDWYSHALKTIVQDEKLLNELQEDSLFKTSLTRTVLGANIIINSLGVMGGDAVAAGPSHVFQVFSGNIPWSAASEWITKDVQFKDLVIAAYRYAVKLSIDQAVLGEVDTVEELSEYFCEYDTQWFIGLDTEPKWSEHVAKNTPHLFALSHSSGELQRVTYHSRVLSNQDTVLSVGSLHAETVRGLWASLNLELLYMTNDDDERYSIQAHPQILRNLTVQAADPPLGYPIYNSPPITVPML